MEKIEKEEKRASFSNKLGFVLAAAGSAVGLGNIWRFPYLAAKYGGGIFLVVYIALVVTFGFSLMVTEIALGRKTALSVIGAYRALSARWAFLGVLSAAVPVIIVGYYCAIGGWVLKYLACFVMGRGSLAAASGYFAAFVTAPWESLLWFLLYALLTFAIVLLGVEKGIEKAGCILMPALVVLMLALTVYALCLPGAGRGVMFYLLPDFSRFSIHTVLAAMGQMFYSMSLASGIMVTYGSYMKKNAGIESAVKQIELFDTGMAFLAGLLIVPAVFVFSGGDRQAMHAGAALMFETIPRIFMNLGAWGNLLGAVFFLLVLFAALTSSMSLMETVVSIFTDGVPPLGRLSRGRSCAATLGLTVCLGGASALGFGRWKNVRIAGLSVMEFLDTLSNAALMPLVALLTCLLVGHVLGPDVVASEVTLSGAFHREKMYRLFIRFVAPVFLAAILVTSLLEAMGVLHL